MFDLLVSHGLFAGLIVIAAVVAVLSTGLAVMLFVKSSKIAKTVDADAVKKELYRRETELVIKIITEKAEGKAREELIAELRRIRSAETLADEIIRAEKTERGIIDKPSAPAKQPARKPAAKPAVNGGKPVAKQAAPAGAKTEAPVKAEVPAQAEAPAKAEAPAEAEKPVPDGASAPEEKKDGAENSSVK